MNTNRKLALASGLALALTFTACGGGNDSPAANAGADNGAGAGGAGGAGPGMGAASVPDSAKANGNSFIGFLNSMKNDETSEPLLIGDGFAVPADETSDPQPFS